LAKVLQEPGISKVNRLIQPKAQSLKQIWEFGNVPGVIP